MIAPNFDWLRASPLWFLHPDGSEGAIFSLNDFLERSGVRDRNFWLERFRLWREAEEQRMQIYARPTFGLDCGVDLIRLVRFRQENR